MQCQSTLIYVQNCISCSPRSWIYNERVEPLSKVFFRTSKTFSMKLKCGLCGGWSMYEKDFSCSPNHSSNLSMMNPDRQSQFLEFSDSECESGSGSIIHYFHTWIDHHMVQTLPRMRNFGMRFRRPHAEDRLSRHQHKSLVKSECNSWLKYGKCVVWVIVKGSPTKSESLSHFWPDNTYISPPLSMI